MKINDFKQQFATDEEDRAAGDQIVLGTITWEANSDSDKSAMAAGRSISFDRASVTLGAGQLGHLAI